MTAKSLPTWLSVVIVYILSRPGYDVIMAHAQPRDVIMSAPPGTMLPRVQRVESRSRKRDLVSSSAEVEHAVLDPQDYASGRVTDLECARRRAVTPSSR